MEGLTMTQPNPIPAVPPEAAQAAGVFERVGLAVVGADPKDAIAACIAVAAVVAVKNAVPRDQARALFDSTWDEYAKAAAGAK
jgi:hypothetical protein